MSNIVKDGAEDLIDSVMVPSSTKGFQEDIDKYEFYDMKQHEVELARRTDESLENVNFFYCLVFRATEKKPSGCMNKIKGLCYEIPTITVEELDNTRHDILEKIEAAGFVTQSVFNSTRDQVIVKIGCNDDRLLREAELREHKLELNPLSLQHVLELKVKEGDPDAQVDKPKHPIYVGYNNYTDEEFAKILNQGGEGTLPLFRTRDGFSGTLTDRPIALSTAKKTFLDQCKADPFKHIHFRYDPDWENQIINDHKVQLYRVYRDGTILRTIDRIDLLLVALARDDTARKGIKGAGLNLNNLIFVKKVEAAYPLEYNNQIRKAKDIDSDEIYRKFKVKTCCGWKMFLPFQQPVQDIRDYCGEKVAYYFAFLEFYSRFLVFSAIFGVAFFIVQLANLNEQTDGYDILNPIFISGPVALADANLLGEDAISTFLQEQNEFVSERTPFAISAGGDNVLFMLTPTEVRLVVIFYAVIIALWGSFFIEFWKRRESTLAFKWGVSSFEKTAEVRPEFVSEYDVPDAVSGLPTPYRSVVKFGTRLIFSAVGVLSLVTVTVAAFAATYVFKAFMAQSESLDPTLAVQVALVLNAVAIIVLGTVFKGIGKRLTAWENHRTDIEYEDQLILKIFVFSFFNSYTTLLYFAFIKSGTELIGQNQYCSADLEDFEVDIDFLQSLDFADADGNIFDNFTDEEVLNNADLADEDKFRIFEANELFKVDSCYGALGYSLIIIFFSQIIINNFQEIGIPYIKLFFKKLGNVKASQKRAAPKVVGLGEEKAEDPEAETKVESRDLPLKSPAERQSLLAAYETPFFDYLELALQFGYVTLFVAAFPLAPLFALLNNFIEVWVDANKVFKFSRRPNVARAQDIGTWLRVFETLSYISIVTNGAVLVFTSVEIVPISNDREQDRVWFFLGFILFVFTIKYIADLIISDTPWSVSIMLKRQEFFEQKIFFDTEDDIERFAVKAGADGKKIRPDDDDEESKERYMELARRFEPLDQDPYMNEIVQEVRTKMQNAGLSKERLFDLIDTGNTNFISLKELKKALEGEDFGIGAELEPQVIRLFVNALDLDGDGKITRRELEQFLDDHPPAAEAADI